MTAPSADSRPLRQLGPYQILGTIGSGGTGVVYQAADPGGSIVALKVLSPREEWQPDLVDRFRREVEVLQRLRHPHIVRVLACSLVRSPRYMVMEFLGGGSLEERLKRGPLPAGEVLSIAAQIGAALDFGHRERAVHRDVKPANIMFDSTGKAYLTDFGVAQDHTKQRLTIDGSRRGTPQYMSPEQFEGTESYSSDLYSLAVVCYEMLTGRAPFRGSADQIYKQITAGVPAGPAAAFPALRLPRAIDEVFLRAMSIDVSQRYPTAAALVSALQRTLGEPAPASSPAAGSPESPRPVTPLRLTPPRVTPPSAVPPPLAPPRQEGRGRLKIVLAATVFAIAALGLYALLGGWAESGVLGP